MRSQRVGQTLQNIESHSFWDRSARSHWRVQHDAMVLGLVVGLVLRLAGCKSHNDHQQLQSESGTQESCVVESLFRCTCFNQLISIDVVMKFVRSMQSLRFDSSIVKRVCF